MFGRARAHVGCTDGILLAQEASRSDGPSLFGEVEARRIGLIGGESATRGRFRTPRPNMPDDGSITRCIDLLKQGNRDAAQLVWQRYFHGLVGPARARLLGAAGPAKRGVHAGLALSDLDGLGVEESWAPARPRAGRPGGGGMPTAAGLADRRVAAPGGAVAAGELHQRRDLREITLRRIDDGAQVPARPRALGAGAGGMSGRTGDDAGDLPPTMVARIDEACDRFEADWPPVGGRGSRRYWKSSRPVAAGAAAAPARRGVGLPPPSWRLPSPKSTGDGSPATPSWSAVCSIGRP